MSSVTYPKLRGRMAERGYSQKYMADKLGITGTAFWNKLHGHNEFKLDEVRIILNVLEANFDDIFSG